MEDFYENKFKKSFNKEWSIKQIEDLKGNVPEFFDSLEILSISEEINVNQRKINKMIAYFKDIVGIEMLLKGMDKKSFIAGDVSKIYAHLLGNGIYQRYRIQNHIGTLYSLRNSIFHQLNINKITRSEDFERYFNGDFDQALQTLNNYHKLLLLRLITIDDNIISKKLLLKEFNFLKNNFNAELEKSKDYRRRLGTLSELDNKLILNLKLKLSKYDDEIQDEIIKITNMTPLDSKYEEKLNIRLKKCYTLGFNSYGGLTEITDSIIGKPKHFYKNDIRIIPNQKRWDEIKKQVDVELSFIFENQYKEVILFLKGHHSLLVYFGYKLSLIENINQINNNKIIFQSYIVNQFNNLIEEFSLDFKYKKHRKLCTVDTNHSQEEDVLLTIVIRHNIFDEYPNELKLSNLDKLPRIIYYYNFKDQNKLITYTNDFKQFCNEIAKDLKERKTIKTIHFIAKTPDVMKILLGKIFSDLNLKVILYEYGIKNIDEKNQFHRVLECNYKL